MPCNMQKDPNGHVDAFAHVGQTATVFVRSTASPQLKVTAAKFNSVLVQVGDDGKIQLPAFKRDNNLLDLTIEGIGAGDDIQLVEDCENAETLCTKIAGSAPGGANPLVGFIISAS